VWLVVDAALPMLVSNTQAVWIGADAVTDRGVINKVGSYALALAAREHSVPVYALAGRRKFIPASTPALQILEMPGSEVWDEAAHDVKPRNVYTSWCPLELLRGVVVEDAVLGMSEVAPDRARALAPRGAGGRSDGGAAPATPVRATACVTRGITPCAPPPRTARERFRSSRTDSR
jgi:hypothetical protein